MTGHPYQLTGAIAPHALGLVVLQADETVEQDVRRLFPGRGIAVYTSRVPSGDLLNTDTIGEMERHLPAAAALLPPARFDVVGYACTSATALIGADRVAALIRGRVAAPAVATPLTGAIAGLRALGVRRLGIVSPYVPTVAEPIRMAFVAAGFEVPRTLSFGKEVEARVARIDPASIRAAALEVGRLRDVDAVFLSCTNLRTLDIIPGIEAELDLPVLSSNQALAWEMARLAGVTAAADAPGRLFTL